MDWPYIIILIVVIILLIYLGFSYRVFRLFFVRQSEKTKIERDTPDNPFWLAEQESIQYLSTLQLEDIYIISKDGLKLHSYFIKAKKESKRVVLIVHGYTSNGLAMGIIARNYYERDFNVLLVDQRAHGESEGKYVGFSYLDSEDLFLWLGRVEAMFNNDCCIVIHGESHGAATVMSVFRFAVSSNLKLLIEDSGFGNGYQMLLETGKSHGVTFGKLMRSGVGLWCRLLAHYSLKKLRADIYIQNATIPGIFIHGEKDNFILRYHFDDLYAVYKGEKEKYLLENCNHALGRYQAPDQYKRIINDAIDKYIEKRGM